MPGLPSNLECVIYAVYKAGGSESSVDTEDVAFTAHHIFPERFSWRKYPGQINLEAVRKRLYDARREQPAARLNGSDRRGWNLTQVGLEWVSEVGDLAGMSRESHAGPAPRGTEIARQKRERRRLQTMAGFEQYLKYGIEFRPSLNDAKKVFKINEYTPQKHIEKMIVRQLTLFQDDAEIRQFLELCAKEVRDGDRD